MHAQFLRLMLEDSSEVKLADALTGGNLYVKSASGEMIQVRSARAIMGMKTSVTACVSPDGTMVEYDMDGGVRRIIPPQQPWLKVGDRVPD